MDERYSTPVFFGGGQLYRPAISQGRLLSDSIIVGFPSTKRSAVPEPGEKKKFHAGGLSRINVNPTLSHTC